MLHLVDDLPCMHIFLRVNHRKYLKLTVNKLLLQAVLLLPSFVFSQVGVGTTNPDASSILDITSTNGGVLMPRMTTAQRDAIVNPARGLIVYNSDTNTLNINAGSAATPLWSILESSNSVKYSNNDTTTNLNTPTVTFVPIFGNLDWNDDISVFNNLSATEMEVLANGRYRIKVNLSITSTAQRPAPEIQVYINGVAHGSFASTGYIRNAGGHSFSSLHIDEIFNLNAGDVISIGSVREANAAGVTMRSVNTSNIYIEKAL